MLLWECGSVDQKKAVSVSVLPRHTCDATCDCVQTKVLVLRQSLGSDCVHAQLRSTYKISACVSLWCRWVLTEFRVVGITSSPLLMSVFVGLCAWCYLGPVFLGPSSEFLDWNKRYVIKAELNQSYRLHCCGAVSAEFLLLFISLR